MYKSWRERKEALVGFLLGGGGVMKLKSLFGYELKLSEVVI